MNSHRPPDAGLSLPSMDLKGLGFAILLSSVLWAVILLMVTALVGAGPEA